MNQAIKAVAKPSSERSKEALLALVCAKPASSKMGPTTPPANIAPASQGSSDLFKPACGAAFGPRAAQGKSLKRRTPAPAPQYNKPARAIGWIEPKRTLAAGVEMPNRTADASA